jgi:hypothetical protein
VPARPNATIVPHLNPAARHASEARGCGIIVACQQSSAVASHTEESTAMLLYRRIIIHPAALKHGFSENDISAALANMIDNYALAGESDKEMAIGWTSSGQLLEIIYLVLDGSSIMVIHAMKCRKQYLRGT